MADEIVVVNDGQGEWAAHKRELFAALVELGWERERWRGYPARRAPEREHEDAEHPYTILCQRVPLVDAEITDDMRRLTWDPEAGLWVWSTP